jgi:hypothetical protein
MVIFVKGTDIIDVKKLCCIMSNIEKNKNEYNMDGTLNKTKSSKKSFNKYIYNQIEFDATVCCGFLVIYSNNLNIPDLINKLTYEFDKNFNGDESYYPSSSTYYKSSQHTVLLSNTTKKGTSSQMKKMPYPYRFLCTNQSEIEKQLKIGARFVWYIHLVNQNDKYIQIQELCDKIPSKIYLKRSISTIIYDSMNIFNVKPNLKQLDYPYINQLTQTLLPIKIRVESRCGLDHEIISKWMDVNKPLYLTTIKYKKCNYSHYITLKVNKDISWENQLKKELSKPFNLEKYKQSELPDDICFISRSPLYGNIYIIEFNRKIPINVDNGVKCYISINSYVFHSMFGNSYLLEYISKKDILINKIFISSYPRTELMVINMIPDNIINKVKKNIMRCISENGACIDKINIRDNKLITYDAEKNIIYLGLPNYIYVITAHKYKNTNTVLFSWQL